MVAVETECLTLEKIAEIVSEILNIPICLITEKKGQGNVPQRESFARQLFCFLATHNTNHSYDSIASYIHAYNHSTTIRAKDKIEGIIYKVDVKRILDEKPAYDLIRACMNRLIYSGYQARGNYNTEILVNYYENVAQL